MARPKCTTDEAVLRVIFDATDLGVPPSLREIAKAVGLRSPAGVYRYLGRLRQKGLVDWEPHKMRTLRVVNRSAASQVLQPLA